jgi:hypothetical protein
VPAALGLRLFPALDAGQELLFGLGAEALQGAQLAFLAGLAQRLGVENSTLKLWLTYCEI